MELFVDLILIKSEELTSNKELKMNTLTKRIFNKHVDRILQSEDFYKQYNKRSMMHKEPDAPVENAELHALSRGVLEVCSGYGLPVRIKVDLFGGKK